SLLQSPNRVGASFESEAPRATRYMPLCGTCCIGRRGAHRDSHRVSGALCSPLRTLACVEGVLCDRSLPAFEPSQALTGLPEYLRCLAFGPASLSESGPA